MSLTSPQYEGQLEKIVLVGENRVKITGWAKDHRSPAPIQVQIVVNGVVRTTVAANHQRPTGEMNGFEATIFAPRQPARICAQAQKVGMKPGFVFGCRFMPFPVPIQVIGEPDQTLPEQFATFFGVYSSGAIAKTLETAPIQNGIAIYSGEPLPNGASWAITVHGAEGLPVFRSGPLEKLPGPPSAVALTTAITVYHLTTGAAFGINSPDGLPELVMQRLNQLPSALTIQNVQFTADSAGHEVVTVTGQIRRFIFLRQSFRYSLPLTLQPE